jgi:hypothetical protein
MQVESGEWNFTVLGFERNRGYVMRIKVTFCVLCAAVASVVALAGVVGQSRSQASVAATGIDQNFLLLDRQTEESFQQLVSKNSNPTVEVLSDWEFTARTRPAKCRFVQ